MKNYIVELEMTNNTDGYYVVVVEGENHLNKTKIKSDIQFFTRQGGYNYCHPEDQARLNAEAIAKGLNDAQITDIQVEFENGEKMKVGYNFHRLKDIPLFLEERNFVKAINKELKFNPEFIGQIINSKAKNFYLQPSEERIALSVIQWLGSPVGQGFLENVQKLNKEE